MANTSTKTKKPASQQMTADELTENIAVESSPSPVDKEDKPIRVKKTLTPDTRVIVRNGYHGMLLYSPVKNGDPYRWGEFGAEEELTLAELRVAKNSHQAFFSNNWFLFDDPEVIEWLGVERYYKKALTYKGFDELFAKSVDEITRTVEGLSSGQKRSLAYHAKKQIAAGEIDSMKVIDALEKGLSVELIER